MDDDPIVGGVRASPDDEASTPLPVLLYHGIHATARSAGVFDARYSVSTAAFTAQLDWLAAAGFRTMRLGQERSEHDVVLTFDDGDVSFAEVALPLLAERGMTAEFFITSDFVGRPGMVGPGQVRALAAGGMGVQSHGRTHRCLDGLTAAELDAELVESRARLEQWSGRPVDAVAAPGGRAGPRELRAAHAAGYRFVLNSVPGPNRDPRPGQYLRRIAITRRTDLAEFSGLVRWRGAAPRRQVLRTAALEVPKRALGNAGYDAIRSVLRRR